MKISWNWLKQLINVSHMSPENVCERLTLAGCEVEDIHYCKILGEEDCIVDITSTPNRADLLNMIGLAREIATILEINQNTINKIAQEIETAQKTLEIEQDKNLLSESSLTIPYFSTFINIEEKNKTPHFIQKALIASGFSPKNNILDIGEYIMLKWGHPLEIIACSNINQLQNKDINFIHKQENLKNRNKSKSLNTLVTYIKKEPVSITGIKVKDDYTFQDNTRLICLQGMIIPVVDIRNNSKYSNLRTESSIRHERGLDNATLELAYIDAILLIKKVYPQAILGNIYNNIIKEEIKETSPILLDPDKVRQVLGPLKSKNGTYEEVSDITINKILCSLNCSVEYDNQIIKVTVPSTRLKDLTREIDLIEEIARIQGFNSFAEILPQFNNNYIDSKRNLFLQELKKRLRLFGLTETLHYSLVSDKEKKIVQLKNPLTTEYNSLRTTLLFNLLESFDNNLKQDNKKLEAFELGRIFLKNTNSNQVTEKEMVSGIFGSNLMRLDWASPLKQVGWFEAKGLLELFIQNTQHEISWKVSIDKKYKTLFHPGKSASLYLKDIEIGVFGQIHPKILKSYNFSNLIYGFEIDVDCLIRESYLKSIESYEFQEYSSFPMIVRDAAIEVPQVTKVASIITTINKNKPEILRKVELFNEYKGINIEKNKKSLTFRFWYKSNTTTLMSEEVEVVHSKLKDKMKVLLNVEFR
uniref:phenylalanyl-tRNA synthetase beta subunit n=1 Tax=Pseudoerythrocladia kornmannii TaxID=753682 RepID=UPI001BEF75C1|nr:phenylalanyl-tRNA synthetase beta subunit [Pseudoerythrocladia kornmannii]QUE28320.1 SyfB [Pseudoerythrocladia kornmannii]UNJ16824.1 phenylalanyl-tRNA synthetase beta subunit [Pseudoerythrocladia kornmannii]